MKLLKSTSTSLVISIIAISMMLFVFAAGCSADDSSAGDSSSAQSEEATPNADEMGHTNDEHGEMQEEMEGDMDMDE